MKQKLDHGGHVTLLAAPTQAEPEAQTFPLHRRDAGPAPKRVGFTGSRAGMTKDQARELRTLLLTMRAGGATEFHHGDCIGSDDQAASIAKVLGYWVVSHPPDDNSKRAYAVFDEEREPLPYIDRNHVIVEETDVLIATPEMDEDQQPRSGTWATVRYAKSLGRRIELLQP